jgi:hypothetical protein
MSTKMRLTSIFQELKKKDFTFKAQEYINLANNIYQKDTISLEKIYPGFKDEIDQLAGHIGFLVKPYQQELLDNHEKEIQVLLKKARETKDPDLAYNNFQAVIDTAIEKDIKDNLIIYYREQGNVYGNLFRNPETSSVGALKIDAYRKQLDRIFQSYNNFFQTFRKIEQAKLNETLLAYRQGIHDDLFIMAKKALNLAQDKAIQRDFNKQEELLTIANKCIVTYKILGIKDNNPDKTTQLSDTIKKTLGTVKQSIQKSEEENILKEKAKEKTQIHQPLEGGFISKENKPREKRSRPPKMPPVSPRANSLNLISTDSNLGKKEIGDIAESKFYKSTEPSENFLRYDKLNKAKENFRLKYSQTPRNLERSCSYDSFFDPVEVLIRKTLGQRIYIERDTEQPSAEYANNKRNVV